MKTSEMTKSDWLKWQKEVIWEEMKEVSSGTYTSNQGNVRHSEANR